MSGIRVLAFTMALTCGCVTTPAAISNPTLLSLHRDYVECSNRQLGTRCNDFFSQALMEVYAVDDFSAPAGSEPMDSYKIIRHIEISDAWRWLGSARDQAVLATAQRLANKDTAVLAVRRGMTTGHLALILPGALQASKRWGMLLPNSLSFTASNAQACYVDKKLSYAFRNPDDVVLYRRR